MTDRLRGLVWQARGAVRPGTVERELDEEHAFHVDMEAARLEGEGLSPHEARRRALVAFGGVERFQQEVRESRWTWRLEEAWRDTRLALRALARRPLFALSAVATMALAIGAATAFFSVVEAILLRPLPVPGPDRLVGVQLVTASGRETTAVSLPDYLDYRNQASGAADLAAQHLSDVTLSAEGGAVAGVGMDVSSNYFRVLGLAPAVGRFFVEGEAERADAPAEVVLSHELWQSRFGGAPDVVGRSLHVNGHELTVVGVAPAGFHGTMFGARPAVFLPLGLYGRLQGRDIGERIGREWLQLVGRIPAGGSTDRAVEALTATADRLASAYDYPEEVEPRDVRLARFSPLPAGQRELAGRSALILLAAALVLLTITAVNVAGMVLARAMERAREISVRMALGAGRARLVAQLAAEGLVLGVVSGAVGIGVAALCLRLAERIRPPGLDGFRMTLPLDGTVIAFAVAAAVGAGLVFGLMPAHRVARRDVAATLGQRRESPAAGRGRAALVGGQVALTLVLLVATALLARTLRNALGTDHGFDPDGLVVAEVNLRLNGYDGDGARGFYETLIERLEASPDVESAALSTSIPLGTGWDQTRASVPGLESPEPSGWPVGWSAVSEGYFETLGFELRGGPPDRTATPPRIVVNDALALLFWNDSAPVGETFRFNGRDAAVAGVVPTGKYRSFSEDARLFAWFPLAFAPSPALYVLVRPRGAVAPAVGALRRAVASVDPQVPLINVTTLNVAMAQSLFLQRSAATFIGAFSVMALLLSATGIFGLLSFTVEQRRREIGIRMAVGAAGRAVVGSVIRKGMTPVLIGLLIGLGGAFGVARALGGLLYEVAPSDPASFVAAGLLLLLVACVAVWAPALRATRVDPAATLKTE